MISYLVCYDIDDDSERARAARVLEAYGERVQYSVFEVHLTRKSQLEALRKELRQILGTESPEVLFYRLTVEGIRDSHRLDGEPIGRRELVVII